MWGNTSGSECFRRGRELVSQGLLEEAVEMYRMGLDRDPSAGHAWMDLGVALKDLGQYIEAEEALLEATRLTPLSGDTWFNLGTLYLRQLGRHEEAVVCFRKAFACNQTDQEAVWFAAEALQRAGRPVEARALLEQTLQEHPEFSAVEAMLDASAQTFRQSLQGIAYGQPDESPYRPELNPASRGLPVRRRRPERTVAPVEAILTGDSSLRFRFTGGASFVIAINTTLFQWELIAEEVAVDLEQAHLFEDFVFETFTAPGSGFTKVELGVRIPVPMAQAVIRASVRHCTPPVYLSLDDQDRRFGYTQRAYVGSRGQVQGVRATEERVRALLDPRLSPGRLAELLLT